MLRRSLLAVLAPVVAVTWFPVEVGRAEDTPVVVDPVGSISRVLVLEGERKRTAEELARLSDTIYLTEETVKSLDAEIASLAEDRNKIRATMIAAAAKEKTIEAEVAATERRITDLAGDEATLKASLRSRRGLLAEVLAALERMGRKPPPALLVQPDDALGSVRSAILLGAVVPRIRRETEKLAADLSQLASVKKEIAAEKQRFLDSMAQQKQEEARLARLFQEKQRLEADSRERRIANTKRAAELAAKADSLQDLIASLDAEAASARAAEEAALRAAEAERVRQAARKAAEAKRAAEREAAVRSAGQLPVGPDERGTPPEAAPPVVASAQPTPPAADPRADYDIASLRREMAEIQPIAAFSTMKGRLTTPVSGHVQVGYGVSDGIGRPSSGVAFSARPGDLVTAPADGKVLYCGPFRSYGQVLILDAGDGYHVVLAGMSRIDVEVGQFVLSGEPVAVMGAQRLASAAETGASELGAAEPALYVEFRKDGKPVDPAPWWTQEPSGRTRNDS